MSGAHFGPTPDNIRDELLSDQESRKKRTRVVPKRFQDCSTSHVDSDTEDTKEKSSQSPKTKRVVTKTNSGKVGRGRLLGMNKSSLMLTIFTF